MRRWNGGKGSDEELKRDKGRGRDETDGVEPDAGALHLLSGRSHISYMYSLLYPRHRKGVKERSI